MRPRGRRPRAKLKLRNLRTLGLIEAGRSSTLIPSRARAGVNDSSKNVEPIA